MATQSGQLSIWNDNGTQSDMVTKDILWKAEFKIGICEFDGFKLDVFVLCVWLRENVHYVW